MAETKTKAPPKDYDADLRIKPYVTEETTDKEVEERFRRAVRGTVSGGAPRREPAQTK